MSNLILADRLGNINFGPPEDLAPHKMPWEYYRILGVPRDASPEGIKRAARKLTIVNHPDKFADLEAQARAHKRQGLINAIRDVLLDDGGELGEKWSRRKLYDRISDYGDFFGAAHIENKGERTLTLAEELHGLLGLEKRRVEAEHRYMVENPEIAEALAKLRDYNGGIIAAMRHQRELVELLAKKEGISPGEFEDRQREAIEKHEEELQKLNQKNRGFSDSLRERINRIDAHKVFDIWYKGWEYDRFSRVTFGISGRPAFALAGYEESEGIVRLNLAERHATLIDPYFVGLRKMHFKALCANDVRIRDAHLEGIFQVVHGRVIVEYAGSSYGTVVRARAPTVTANGFVRSGDLYVPKSFAVEGWEEREPKVDIAVFDGAIDLIMIEKTIQERGGIMALLAAIDPALSYRKKE